jgi:pyruvate/2-oxoglutarate dehydrogenase complex dihydrolipoamide dehydrogenase (E3) component
VELAQAMARLGTEVTLIEREDRLLGREEPELVDRLVDVLREEGVRVETGVAVERVHTAGGTVTAQAGERTWTAARLFAGTGRMPNADGLGLEALGIRTGPRGVEVDARSRTAVPSIYAVGDLAGRYRLTHAAAQEAALVVRDLAFPGRARFDQLVPWATFTDPELAHAGLTSSEASEKHGEDVETWRMDLERSDRARADGTGGMLLAVTHRRRLVGAHVLAPAAGELIAELALAIQHKLKLDALSGLIHPYPTYATSVAQLAAEAAIEQAQRHRWLVRL